MMEAGEASVGRARAYNEAGEVRHFGDALTEALAEEAVESFAALEIPRRRKRWGCEKT